MKKMNEHKISIVLFSISLVLYGISIITGLIPGYVYSTDKICMYLGFAFMGLGLTFLYKSKEKDNNEEK